MDKLLFDLHDIFADNFGLYPSDIGIVSLFVFGGMLSFLSFILSIYIFIKIILRRPKKEKKKVEPKIEEPIEEPMTEEVNIEVGEFGKVVSDQKVLVKGVELDYFILKKTKFEQSSLPVGTIVIVLRRTDKEAYVKAADEKDVKRLKGKI